MICEMCGEEIDEAVCPFCLTQQSCFQPQVSGVKVAIMKVNIKEDMPTADLALNRLITAVTDGRRSGFKAIKVVHGYGSTGKGGVIKETAQRYFSTSDQIADWIPGEEFSADYSETRSLLKKFPFLEKDKDFRRRNRGISIAIF